jgi:hypothetical protein
MSTLIELTAHRATAGARYAAAVAELRSAFGDLAAIERLIESKLGQIGTFGGPRPDPIPLRVCPGTSSGITKFSEHEAD